MIVNALPEDVTWFTSEQAGAPKIMGQSNGDLLKVLDACLINGWGLTDTIGIASTNDSVTITFPLAHGFMDNQTVLIKGAVNPQLNGRHRARRMTSNTIDVDVAGVVDEIGVITVELPPLGWESIFGATDLLKRAYRSKSTSNAKRVLYLNMDRPANGGYHATSPATRASLSVCEDMQVLGEQIGSFTDSINNFNTWSNGSLFWYQKKARNVNLPIPNTESKWKVVGNKDFFLILVGWLAETTFDSKPIFDVWGFGEITPIVDSAQDKTFLMCYTQISNDGDTSDMGNQGASMGFAERGNISAYCFGSAGFSKKMVSIAIPQAASNLFFSGGTSSAYAVPYPNAYGDALFSMACKVYDSDLSVIGFIPSLLYLESNTNGVFDNKVVDDTLLVRVQKIRSTNAYSPSNYGFYVGG